MDLSDSVCPEKDEDDGDDGSVARKRRASPRDRPGVAKKKTRAATGGCDEQTQEHYPLARGSPSPQFPPQSADEGSESSGEGVTFFRPPPIPAKEFSVPPPKESAPAVAVAASSVSVPMRRPPQTSAAPIGDRRASDYAGDPLMRPGRLPVLNPDAVQQDYLALRLNHAAVAVAAAVGDPSPNNIDGVINSYVPTQDSMSVFERLDVLVCGKCQSVFHLLDQFRSHSAGCNGSESNQECIDSTDTAVAMVLWCNTVRRRLSDSGVLISDTENVGRKIQQKWFRLSKKAQIGWIRAAKSLRSLGEAGKIVFGGKEHYPDLIKEYEPPLWVEGQNGPCLDEVKQEVSNRWSDFGMENPQERTSSPPVLPKVLVVAPRRQTKQRIFQRKHQNQQQLVNHDEDRATCTTQLPFVKEVGTSSPTSGGSTSEQSRRSSPLQNLNRASSFTQTEDMVVSEKQHNQGIGVPEEILAKRGEEYCVMFKDHPDPMWQSSSSLDLMMVQEFERQSRLTADPNVPFQEPRDGGSGHRGVFSSGSGRGSSGGRRQGRQAALKDLRDTEVAVEKAPNADKPQGNPSASGAPEVQIIRLGGAGATTLLEASLKLALIQEENHVKGGEKKRRGRKHRDAKRWKTSLNSGNKTDDDETTGSSEIAKDLSGGVSGMNLFGRPRLGRPPKNAPKVASELSKRSPGKQQKSPGIKKDRNERDENGIPIKLKALVPPGFEMIRHINEQGKEEFRVKKLSSNQESTGHSVRSKSSPNSKVIELGKKRCSGSEKKAVSRQTSDNIKTILVGGSMGETKGKQITDPKYPQMTWQPAGHSDASNGSQQFVKLTYRPTPEDMALSKSLESLNEDGEESENVPTDYGGIFSASGNSSAPAEVTSSTDDGTNNKRRTDDQLQEVTTTSTIDGASTHPVRQPKQQHLSADGAAAAEECDLDPITGMLVTKDGSPFSVDKLVGETKSIEQTVLQVSAPAGSGPSSVAILEQPMYSASLERPGTSSTSPGLVLSHQQPVVTYDSGPSHAPPAYNVGGNSQVYASAGATAPRSSGPSLQLSEDGAIILPPLDSQHAQHHVQSQPQQQVVDASGQFISTVSPPGGGSGGSTTPGGTLGTTNKVLLVLPGGQMILTDLTDEQCGQLNIQVNHPVAGALPSQQPVQAAFEQEQSPTLIHSIPPASSTTSVARQAQDVITVNDSGEQEDGSDGSAGKDVNRSMHRAGLGNKKPLTTEQRVEERFLEQKGRQEVVSGDATERKNDDPMRVGKNDRSTEKQDAKEPSAKRDGLMSSTTKNDAGSRKAKGDATKDAGGIEGGRKQRK